MIRSVGEEAVEFLLLYLARTGPNPEYRQAQTFLDRIEADRAEAERIERAQTAALLEQQTAAKTKT